LGFEFWENTIQLGTSGEEKLNPRQKDQISSK